MVLIEIWSGAPVSLVVPAIFLVLVSAFVGMQVKAARIHVSVELTEDALRQGTETILVREIVKVYPEPENHRGLRERRWRSGSRRGRSANWSGCRAAGRHRSQAHRPGAPPRPGRVVIVTCGRR